MARDKASKEPHLKTLGDVVRWVVDELGAMCPAPERLQAYNQRPNDPALRDVRYHVEEAQCRICNAERERWKASSQPG
ncbi:MAG: hypothetical protein NZ899_05610 [Thermoguttaceae bacterium]|nr:hypothetical protein [Thermoguttaceae bacterium]MDW8079417.1 hypothetical protein [Thermoguttaceae bacterium]